MYTPARSLSLPHDNPSSSAVVKSWHTRHTPSSSTTSFNKTAEVEVASPTPDKVAFVGLGAMGYGMASHLTKSGLHVVGWDVFQPAMDRYAAAGGSASQSLERTCADAQVLVLMVINASQAEDVLFARGAAQALSKDAVIILMCTVGPSEVRALAARLAAARSDLRLLDAPVSGGTPRAAIGDLTILCSGLDDAGPHAGRALAVLEHLSQARGNLGNLVRVPGGVGSGAAVKLVNQHQAGTHIASTAEGLVLACKLGLPLRQTRRLLLDGPAQTWMLGHRGELMLDGRIQPPTSAINIFVKDTGLVVDEAEVLGVGVPLISLVQQKFVECKGRGWGGDDDSGLARLWQDVGVDVRCPPELPA